VPARPIRRARTPQPASGTENVSNPSPGDASPADS
jgi:hypothetical protein